MKYRFLLLPGLVFLSLSTSAQTEDPSFTVALDKDSMQEPVNFDIKRSWVTKGGVSSTDCKTNVGPTILDETLDDSQTSVGVAIKRIPKDPGGWSKFCIEGTERYAGANIGDGHGPYIANLGCKFIIYKSGDVWDVKVESLYGSACQ